MKSSVYPLSIDNPPLWANLYFYKKILIPLLWFFKNPNPLINKRGSHYKYNISSEAVLMVRWTRVAFDQPYKQTESKMQGTVMQVVRGVHTMNITYPLKQP